MLGTGHQKVFIFEKFFIIFDFYTKKLQQLKFSTSCSVVGQGFNSSTTKFSMAMKRAAECSFNYNNLKAVIVTLATV